MSHTCLLLSIFLLFSVITSTNRIEKAAGSETRFGRRDQVLKLKEVYEFGTDL